MQWHSAIVVTCLIPSVAHTQTIAVLPVDGSNISTGESAAIGALFAEFYGETSGQSILSPSRLVAAADEHGIAPYDAALALGATEIVTLKVVRLKHVLRWLGLVALTPPEISS